MKTLYKQSILRGLFLLLMLFSLSACEHRAAPFMPQGPISLPPFPPLPDFDIAIWSAGMLQGDFGFDRCERQLLSSGGSRGERIGEWLRQGGYTRAVIFGSTPEYDFIDFVDDPDGLVGPEGDPAAIADLNVGLVTISSGDFNYQSEFGGNTLPFSEFSRTGNVSASLVLLNPEIAALMRIIGIRVPPLTESFWSFTNFTGNYDMSVSCNDSTNAATGTGRAVHLTSSGELIIGGSSGGGCNDMHHVICIGRR